MKKLPIIIFFSLWNLAVFSQYLPVTPTDVGTNFNRVKPWKVLHIPVYNGDLSLNTTDTSAQLRINDGKLQYHYGTWQDAGGGGTTTWQQALNFGSVLTRNNSINNSGRTFTFNGGNLQLTDSTATPLLNSKFDYKSISITDSRSGSYDGSFVYDAIARQFYVTFKRQDPAQTWISFTVDTSHGLYYSHQSGNPMFRVDTSGKVFMNYLSTSTGAFTQSLLFNPTTKEVGVGTASGGSFPNLQQVTDVGAVTTNSITVQGKQIRGLPGVSETVAFGNTAGASFAAGGGWSVAIGDSALRLNTTGYANTAVGRRALSSNVTGQYITAIGYDALRSANVGGTTFNTAVGASSLSKLTSGTRNTALGTSAMQNNFTSNYNTAVGANSLFNSASGDDNTVIGANAGYNLNAGAQNVMVGRSAGYVINGNNNVALGWQALYNAFGSDNIGVGSNSGNNIGSGANNNIAIGSGTQFPSGTASNQMNIGNRFYDNGNGNIGLYTTNPTQKFHVKGQVRIDSILTGVGGTDSVLTVKDGVIQKVLPSTIGGGGGSGSKFGVPGEDDIATNQRRFNLNGNNFYFDNFNYMYFTGDQGIYAQIQNRADYGIMSVFDYRGDFANFMPNRIEYKNTMLFYPAVPNEDSRTFVTSVNGVIADYQGNVDLALSNDLNLKFKTLTENKAPSSPNDSGKKGEVIITKDYIYICVSTDKWVRAALSPW